MSHGIDVTVDPIKEGTTPEISAVLLDLNDVPIPGGVLTALKLTHYQQYSLAIINSRNAQNVLQTNNVTVDSNGKMVWKMVVADTVILNDALDTEPHVAYFEFSYLDGADTKVGRLVIVIPVENILRDAS